MGCLIKGVYYDARAYARWGYWPADVLHVPLQERTTVAEWGNHNSIFLQHADF
jgi:hypothetical protein